MPINSDKPHRWKQDIAKSVDLFNDWFLKFSAKTSRQKRAKTTTIIEQTLALSKYFTAISAKFLEQHPESLQTFRMATCPPLSPARLARLSSTTTNVIATMERGELPRHMGQSAVTQTLKRIAAIITRMLDHEVFPWLAVKAAPSLQELEYAATVVSDRFNGVVGNRIALAEYERRQLNIVADYLNARGYRQRVAPLDQVDATLGPREYLFPVKVPLVMGANGWAVFDLLIHPKRMGKGDDLMPTVIDVRSCSEAIVKRKRGGDLQKLHDLRMNYGGSINHVFVISGVFEPSCLGKLSAAGIDWVWQHEICQLTNIGL